MQNYYSNRVYLHLAFYPIILKFFLSPLPYLVKLSLSPSLQCQEEEEELN